MKGSVTEHLTKRPRSAMPKRPMLRAGKRDEYADLGESLKITKTLGIGPFSKVMLGSSENGKVGVKIYEKSSLCDLRRKSEVRREISIMQQLHHQNVVELFNVIDTHKHLCLVMEFIDGVSLWHYVRQLSNKRLGEQEAKFIFKQILEGVNYCHSQLIAHRDIKLENILIDKQSRIKIIDFGFATRLPKNKKMQVFCGTPWYMAPEIIDNKAFCGLAADVWALGVLLYVIVVGNFPINARNNDELFRVISKGQFNIPVWVSEEPKNLISAMMHKDPSQRPTTQQLLRNEWFYEDDV